MFFKRHRKNCQNSRTVYIFAHDEQRQNQSDQHDCSHFHDGTLQTITKLWSALSSITIFRLIQTIPCRFEQAIGTGFSLLHSGNRTKLMLWLTFFSSKPAGKLLSISFDWRCSSHLAGVVRCAKFNYHFDCITMVTRLDHSELTFAITLSIESANELTIGLSFKAKTAWPSLGIECVCSFLFYFISRKRHTFLPLSTMGHN